MDEDPRRQAVEACRTLIEYADCDEPTDAGEYDMRVPDDILDSAISMARDVLAKMKNGPVCEQESKDPGTRVSHGMVHGTVCLSQEGDPEDTVRVLWDGAPVDADPPLAPVKALRFFANSFRYVPAQGYGLPNPK